jgi:hypothetical protein
MIEAFRFLTLYTLNISTHNVYNAFNKEALCDWYTSLHRQKPSAPGFLVLVLCNIHFLLFQAMTNLIALRPELEKCVPIYIRASKFSDKNTIYVIYMRASALQNYVSSPAFSTVLPSVFVVK